MGVVPAHKVRVGFDQPLPSVATFTIGGETCIGGEEIGSNDKQMCEANHHALTRYANTKKTWPWCSFCIHCLYSRVRTRDQLQDKYILEYIVNTSRSLNVIQSTCSSNVTFHAMLQ